MLSEKIKEALARVAKEQGYDMKFEERPDGCLVVVEELKKATAVTAEDDIGERRRENGTS
jgi:hypothetical protein